MVGRNSSQSHMAKGQILFDGNPDNVDPLDRHFILREPEKGFNPSRNKSIIEDTIRWAEQQRTLKNKEHDEDYAERSDAVVSYLRALDRGMAPGTDRMQKYFGKRTLAYLRGEEIRRKLMANMAVMKGKSLIKAMSK